MKKNQAVASPECLCITIATASRMLGVSRSTVYEMCRLKQLPVVRCGQRRLMIPKAPFMRMLNGESPVQTGAQ